MQNKYIPENKLQGIKMSFDNYEDLEKCINANNGAIKSIDFTQNTIVIFNRCKYCNYLIDISFNMCIYCASKYERMEEL